MSSELEILKTEYEAIKQELTTAREEIERLKNTKWRHVAEENNALHARIQKLETALGRVKALGHRIGCASEPSEDEVWAENIFAQHKPELCDCGYEQARQALGRE